MTSRWLLAKLLSNYVRCSQMKRHKYPLRTFSIHAKLISKILISTQMILKRPAVKAILLKTLRWSSWS